MRPAPQHAPPLEESLGMLERSIGYTRVSLHEVAPSLLCAPTPCSRWDLATLLDHMEDGLAALTDAAALGRVDLASLPGPASPVDVVERLKLGACSLLGAWTPRARPTDVLVGDQRLGSSLLACAGALEVAVHGWDVAVACGAVLPLPDALATDLLPLVPVLVADADRPGRFADRVDVPRGASAATALLALLGRPDPMRRG
jgi:uncharacterized protein (TIGR03086 family)